MPFQLQIATADDVADLIDLRSAVSERLTSVYGHGPWTQRPTDKTTLREMRLSSVFIVRREGFLIAALSLSTRKPWAIDPAYFQKSRRPLYLTSMAVHPGMQRKGIGRMCVQEACRIAREWPSDAIRLDAFDAEAGAGEFYRKCGFREIGRAVYRRAPLIYFEIVP